MKFDFDGKTYWLEFERARKTVSILRNGRTKHIHSENPYTFARLFEWPIGVERRIIASADAGCFPGDKFTKAEGRLRALQALSKQLKRQRLPEGLTAAMWQRYNARTPEHRDPAKVLFALRKAITQIEQSKHIGFEEALGRIKEILK